MSNDPKPETQEKNSKSGNALPSLWLICLINGSFGLLMSFVVYRPWHNHHLPGDWWGAVFVGLGLFVITMAVQLWGRRVLRQRERAQSTLGPTMPDS